VDKHVSELNGSGSYILGCAHDIGKFPNTISDVLQEALGVVQQWCDRTQLSINPQNTVIVPFTRKRDLRGLNEPTFSGKYCR
jgi:hypothetical protein